MPVAERTPEVPQGQPYGEAAQQENFIESTAPAQQAPVTPNGPPPFAPPPAMEQEKPQPNLVDLGDGNTLNLDEVLFQPSRRPDESVLGGEHASIGDLFDEMAKTTPAADIQSLANLARKMGL